MTPRTFIMTERQFNQYCQYLKEQHTPKMHTHPLTLTEAFYKVLLESAPLLTEAVTPNKVMDQIRKRERVMINYESDDTEQIDSGKRWVDIYQYGTTFRGNPCFRAYETGGATFSNHQPMWRLFLLKNVKSWKTYGIINKTPQELFNTEGDRGMAEVYMIADYGNVKPKASKTTNVAVDQSPSSNQSLSSDMPKTDTEKEIEQQRVNKPAYKKKYLNIDNSNDKPILDINPFKQDNQEFDDYDVDANGAVTPAEPSLNADIPKTDTEQDLERIKNGNVPNTKI